MMLDYEWGNSAAAAAAMMLFGDESGGGGGDPGATDERALAMFDHYAGHGIGGASAGDCIADYFAPPPQQLTAAALFSPTPSSSSTCDARYGLALQPAPSRIGLNLGVRTYFSSSLPGESSGLAPGRVTRRRVRTARCQAEGCGADLTHAKHYHRRHKVCEFHSKASVVIAAGLSQRFCQQCSRFHVLSEFDHGKRSCRKRLADHNRRRRKSQDLTPTTITQSNNNGSTITTADGGTNSTASPQKLEMLFFTTSSSSSTAPPPFARCKPETNASIMAPNVPSSPAPALHYSSPTKMALGLGCGGVVTLQTGLSASSSTETSPPSVSFLSQLGEFRSGHEQRFGGWDDGEDGCSIRELFQSK